MAMKELGLSLEQIGLLFESNVSNEQIRGMLRLKQVELQMQVYEEQKQLAMVEFQLRMVDAEKAFLPECPYVLAQIEFPGVDTGFLARLIGVEAEDASPDWVGMYVKGRFRRLSSFKPTDICVISTQ